VGVADGLVELVERAARALDEEGRGWMARHVRRKARALHKVPGRGQRRTRR